MLCSYWSGKWIIFHPYQKSGSEIAAFTWVDSHVCLQSCPRALRKRQFMEHHTTIQPELSIVTWVLSDSPSHKVGWAQQQSILNWKWYSQDWTRMNLEGTDKLQEVLGQTHVSSTTVFIPAVLPHLLFNMGVGGWDIPHDPLMEKTPKPGSWGGQFGTGVKAAN